MRNRTSASQLLLVCLCFLVLASCSALDDASEDCGLAGGQTTLQIAGMESADLTIVESCITSNTGILPAETRIVVASGSRDAVMAALEAGDVDPLEASPSFDDALRGPESFDVAVAPRGEEWRLGERLAYRDVLDGHDLRYRYVAWGKQLDGDQYVLMLRLGTEVA